MNFSFDDIDFRSVWKDLLRNIWVIILAALAAVFLTDGIYRLQYTPKYTSFTTLAVGIDDSSNNAYLSLQKTQQMAGVFKEVFESETLSRKIASTLETDEIQADIEVSLVEGTNLMNLSVTSESPKDAYLILQAALKNYQNVSDSLFSNARLDVLKVPAMPFAPSNVRGNRRMTVIVCAAAILLSAGLIVLFSVTRPTVKKVSRARYQLDGKVLGAIPFVRKFRSGRKQNGSGKRQKDKQAVLVSSALYGRPFVESNRRIAAVAARHMKMHHEKVLVVTSVGENEGKSSVAANIALSLADRNFRVLLMDGDWLKPSLHKIFEADTTEGVSISDLLEGKKKLEHVLKEMKPGFYVAYQFHPVSNPVRFLSSDEINLFVNTCRDMFDFIIVDSPPMGLSSNTEQLMRLADASVLVVRSDFAEIGVINDLADVLRRSEKDFVGFILNRFEGIGASFSSDSGSSHGHSAHRESYTGKGGVTNG